jgi:uncharacterized flavoprotein (TIGR03862 family)
VTATVAVVGAGPAGLMAAEQLARAGHRVTVYERMPSPGRKFLMAGRGGLNITHSEDIARFAARYGPGRPTIAPLLAAFPPEALIAWVNGLGIETFTGSSGRVFPRSMKTSPLLRAWLARLEAMGVRLALRHDWQGFDAAGALVFATPHAARVVVRADATVLALGGASWPRLGSNGAWVGLLERDGVPVAPLAPANCGILIPWSDHMTRHSGTPLKRIGLTCGDATVRGEAIVTRTGLEGGAVYALAGRIREARASTGRAELALDLRPDMPRETDSRPIRSSRGKQSASTFLRKTLKLPPVAIALLRETGQLPAEGPPLASRIKAVPLMVTGTAGLERAISTSGGVAFEGLDGNAMLRARPGVFVAGEMLDWDAPTGGYLLQATFATAVAAARGAGRWLQDRPPAPGLDIAGPAQPHSVTPPDLK